MMKKCSVLLCACIILSSIPGLSLASDFFGKAPEGEVSIIEYGLHGMGVGLYAGLSAGYIRYKDETDKGKEILVSGGYGTLIGAGIGLILGAVDASSGKKGIGATILRNMNSGGKFGLLLGTIWGGINAINKNDTRLIGEGAAWGYIGGAAFGALAAFIETPKPSPKAGLNRNFESSVAFMQDSRRKTYPALTAKYNF
jgi:hypothetical protein